MGEQTSVMNSKNVFVSRCDTADVNEYNRMTYAVRTGKMIRVRAGVYAECDAMFNNMIDIERVVPRGVLCLYNAWSYYGLTTVVPPGFCVAIDAKRKIVMPETTQVTLYYWQAKNLEFGITKVQISGFEVRITDRERCVCDAIKYRNKFGMEVCQEVLRSYLSLPDRNIALLCEYARKLRVANVLNKYLEIQL